MSEIVVFDTSALVEDLRTARHQPRISSLTGRIRTSSVLLAELWRGATKAAELKFLRALEKNHSRADSGGSELVRVSEAVVKTSPGHRFHPREASQLATSMCQSL